MHMSPGNGWRDKKMKSIQLFVNTDEQGNIVDAQFGENIIMTDSFSFSFLVDENTIQNLHNYKVEIVDFKTHLIEKEQAAE